MEIEDQYKSKITENRLIPISFLNKLKDVDSRLPLSKDEQLEEQAAKIIGRIDFDSENRNQQILVNNYYKKNKFLSYLNALSDAFIYSNSSLTFSHLYYDEIMYHFPNARNCSEDFSDTYLNQLLFLTKINLETSFIYQFALFDKLAQLLNIYFNLRIDEKKVYFNEIIRVIEHDYYKYFSLLGFNTTALNDLFNVRKTNQKGIPIFTDSRSVRDELMHRISEISDKFHNYDVIEKHHDLAIRCSKLSISAMNSFYQLIIDNEMNIHVLYK